MKMSEYFNTMDEVHAFVESYRSVIKNERDFKLFQSLFGVLENQGISETVEIHGELVQIDKYIAPLIKELAALGYRTLACCSGIKEDHPDMGYKPESAYISFVYNPILYKEMSAIFPGQNFSVEESECYLQHSISLRFRRDNDDGLRAAWEFVGQRLKELSAKF